MENHVPNEKFFWIEILCAPHDLCSKNVFTFLAMSVYSAIQTSVQLIKF